MDDERDECREAYRSVWKTLDVLNEHERRAIMREATRKAKQKENFWFIASFLPTIILAFTLQANLGSLSPWLAGGVISTLLITVSTVYLKHKHSRIVTVGRQAMAILARKCIRPPFCLCCESKIETDAAEHCAQCKTILWT